MGASRHLSEPIGQLVNGWSENGQRHHALVAQLARASRSAAVNKIALEKIHMAARQVHTTLLTHAGRKPGPNEPPLGQTLIAIAALEPHLERAVMIRAHAAIMSWVMLARTVLGYEDLEEVMRHTECFCGGAFVIRSEVIATCIGSLAAETCGRIYPREQWLDVIVGRERV